MHFVRVTFAEVQSQRRKRNDAAHRSFSVRPPKNHKTSGGKIQHWHQCRRKSKTFWFGCRWCHGVVVCGRLVSRNNVL